MSSPSLAVLALEPWLGGSHARMLETWRARSRHEVQVLGMPARHWRWRMEASAWSLGERIRVEGTARPDVVFVSDYVDVPRLRGFLPREWADVPVVLYMHENQLTYPRSPDAPPSPHDASYGFTNVLSCLAADVVVFNSAFHLREFRAASARLLASLPRPKPARELETALEAAHVVGPGVELDALPLGPGAPAGAPLRVAFNHRWEHDKDPLAFLRAVRAALETGVRIELVLLGERFEELPAATVSELQALEGCVLHAGFADSRADYAAKLGSCDLVCSTALHEFYGIAVLEGVATGCTALAPNRLAYPDVLPRETELYEDGELVRRLIAAARAPEPFRSGAARARLRDAVHPHALANSAKGLDDTCVL
ncbi:MAG: DUF3524 domain-containing protein [bacterium]|nr:DUF3524 domain-containing protein [bacterium]